MTVMSLICVFGILIHNTYFWSHFTIPDEIDMNTLQELWILIYNTMVLCTKDTLHFDSRDFWVYETIMCQIFHIILGTSPSIPPKTITTGNDIFNQYIKPSQGVIWCQHALNIHEITPSDVCIQSAETIEDMWNEFYTFMDKHIFSNEVGILLMYNGDTCDLKWLWKLINIPNSSMSMPPKSKFFLDPLKVLRHYKSCLLYPPKTILELSNLQSIYNYITGADLIGVHNSTIDCKAQTAIAGSETNLVLWISLSPYYASLICSQSVNKVKWKNLKLPSQSMNHG